MAGELYLGLLAKIGLGTKSWRCCTSASAIKKRFAVAPASVCRARSPAKRAKVEPYFDSIRSEPRYLELVNNMHFPA